MSEDLERFVEAQAGAYDHAIAELRAGEKRSHWMWFVFPQIQGLGRSPMAQRYAIASLDEAQAYLAHPLLGARLRECVEAILAHRDLSAHAIFGMPDDDKLRSSLTLFAAAAPQEPLFGDALDAFFGGELDPLTLARLPPAASQGAR
ncbi:MAG TPA: DUF1810 domain-containing protein [Phenylobacterium sp.]